MCSLYNLCFVLSPKMFRTQDPTFNQFKNWLSHLGAGEYVHAFVSAGYDLTFIRKHGLNDADLNCVMIPASKLGLRKKLVALYQLENFTRLNDEDTPSEKDSSVTSASDVEADSDN